MILCEWDASEGNPGQSCVHLYPRILSTSFTSVSIFSVWCYSSLSVSMSWSQGFKFNYSAKGGSDLAFGFKAHPLILSLIPALSGAVVAHDC